MKHINEKCAGCGDGFTTMDWVNHHDEWSEEHGCDLSYHEECCPSCHMLDIVPVDDMLLGTLADQEVHYE